MASVFLLSVYALMCIQLSSAQGNFHTPHQLSYPNELSIMSCEMVYDTRNLRLLGPYRSATCSRRMPCTCAGPIFSRLLLEETSITHGFVLTDHSSLDFTIYFGQQYQLLSLAFQWHNTSNPINQAKSYVSVYDISTNAWVDQTYKVYPDYDGLTRLDTNGTFVDLIVTHVRFHLEWNFDAQGGFVYPSGVYIHGQTQTLHPIKSPSTAPTHSPTADPTTEPTVNPSLSPTPNPSETPTTSPTQAPTWKRVTRQTKRVVGVDSIQIHSNNIIPLSQRDAGNITYKDYYLPNIRKPDGSVVSGHDRPFCLTCILAWADIDASIELEGCPEVDDDGVSIWNHSDVNPDHANSIYHCDTGTWRLKSSGRLADWQDTYGRFEVWEVDSRGIKWLQWSFEFNWQNNTCFFINDGTIEECDVLPLTNDTRRAAYFEFTMPKRWGDARTAPLIAVWYDLLALPYAIRPELEDEYVNFTFTPIQKGDSFGYQDAVDTFVPAGIATGILFVCFVAIMIFACCVSTKKLIKRDFMIDATNLRTTVIYAPETIPPSAIQTRARFRLARHGPWLLVVLIARLIYMFIFTFTFFWLVFQAFNKSHFDTLAGYDQFALERDTQLVDFSRLIERHYANESDRMERELQFRQSWCFNHYINATLLRFVEGSQGQEDYHTQQMDHPLGNINVNLSAFKNIFVLGDGHTACNPSQTDGAIVWISSKLSPVTYIPLITTQKLNVTSDTTYTVQVPADNATALYAQGYDTSFSNFSDLESVLGPMCDDASWCYGWGFTNRNALDGEDAYYMMFNEMADPAFLDGISGVCYGSTHLDEELSFLKFNSSYFNDYTQRLNDQYMKEFQSYAADMYDTVSGLWRAIQDIPDTFPGQFPGYDTFNFHFNEKYNYSELASYGLNFDYDYFATKGNTKNKTLEANMYLDLNVMCPNCPQGNFTKQVLQFATAFLVNGSNISDYTNLSDLPVNISNLISINTAFIEFPDLPTIELPFVFDFPIDFSFLAQICITLDFLLLIYRWYRTTGIVAGIVRGKDVDVPLTYVEESQYNQKCCHGRTLIDYCLNCIIYCHDKLFRLSYNLWKLFYWFWWLFQIAIVALLVLMLYYLADQILTVQLMEAIGTFDLMTVGIGAQRSVRNQVLSTTALGYNNYTLANMHRSVADYAKERNDDAWQQNTDELKRVDQWNAVFCQGWIAYQTVARDVTTESPLNAWVNLNSSSTSQQVKNEAINVCKGTYYTYEPVVNVMDPSIDLFDGDERTYWRPYVDPSDVPSAQDMWFDFYLSPIYMTDDLRVGWDIVQITFNWRFEYDDTNQPIDHITAIFFEIYIQDTHNDTLYLQDRASYAPEVTGSPRTRQSVVSFVQYITIPMEVDTRRVRLKFLNVSDWGTEYYLNDLTIAGHAPESQVKCPTVDFRFWDFDASPTKNENASQYIIAASNTYYDADGTYIEYCPQVTPIHGLMFRGFVRKWLNDQLIEGHVPFILAVRNIALAPFYISIALVGVLFVAYLFAFIMEWFLLRSDLYRENPYVRIPLVTTHSKEDESDDGYEAGDHVAIRRSLSVGEYYYNPIEDDDGTELVAGAGNSTNYISRDVSSSFCADPPSSTEIKPFLVSKRCVDCGKKEVGKIYDGDGLFYCNKCWASYG
eukprot:207275_1